MLTADGAISLTVASAGTPFRILSPKYGIFVNADACAFQSLLQKAVLSGRRERFQDNQGLSQGQTAASRDAETLQDSEPETLSFVCRGLSAFRASEKDPVWRVLDAAD